MSVVQPRGNVARNLERSLDWQLTLTRESIAQRLALDKRHHVIQQATCRARIVNRKDVRMLQTGCEMNFAIETLYAYSHR